MPPRPTCRGRRSGSPKRAGVAFAPRTSTSPFTSKFWRAKRRSAWRRTSRTSSTAMPASGCRSQPGRTWTPMSPAPRASSLHRSHRRKPAPPADPESRPRSEPIDRIDMSARMERAPRAPARRGQRIGNLADGGDGYRLARAPGAHGGRREPWRRRDRPVRRRVPGRGPLWRRDGGSGSAASGDRR